MAKLFRILLTLLRSEKVVGWLFLMNVVAALGMIWLTKDTKLGDTWSYLGLAEGILHGKYSMWWELPGDYPDTFRAPGFPLFIAIIIWMFGSWKAVIWVNLVLYCAGLYLALRTIRLIDPRPEARNLMLLLLLPLLNVPYYIGQAYPEIPSLVAICAVLFMLARYPKPSVWHGVVLGCLYGFIFQCKPIFLLFPFVLPLMAYAVQRKGAKPIGHLVSMGVFTLTLLPYGLWNQVHHGVFSVTPLEGGGGVMHIGLWAGKIPGYTEHVYWGNFTGDELVRFTPEDSIPANIRAYEREWENVNEQLKPFLMQKDSIMITSRAKVTYRPVHTYNTAYTMERERLLKELTIRDALRSPGYTIAYKAYTAARMWVIGIQRGDFDRASTLGKVGLLYGPVTTGLMFLMFNTIVLIAYWRKRLRLKDTWYFLLFLVYFGLIHIPFVIQVRYTTPVRIAMVTLLALAIASFMGGHGGDRRVASDTA
jgi:hypothetical protein